MNTLKNNIYKFHRVSMKNDATLYYDVLLNSMLTSKIYEICAYTDEYINMNTALTDITNLRISSKVKPTWIDFLNVACYRNFIIKNEEVGPRTGNDLLNHRKYDSYEIFVYEQLNKVITRKYIQNKERNKLPKNMRKKKSLLPFLDKDR